MLGALSKLVVIAICSAALAAIGCFDDPSSGAHPCAACLACESCVEGPGGPTCAAASQQAQMCVGNEVHWFDSCGADEGVAETCPEHATCESAGESDAACVCTNHWQGDGCDVCPGNWDSAQDCAACEGNYDPATSCEACLQNWSSASACTACEGNWDVALDCLACENQWIDEGNDCGTCPGNWDWDEDCNACQTHWAGDDCEICPGNWDAAANCGACETHWEGTDCETCPGNWDPLASCSVCENHWIDEGNDCGTCPGNWDAVADCDACETNWEGVDCGTCPGNWDPLANCSACQNHWIDGGNDCGTCPENWDAAADCNACQNHWTGSSCTTCPGNWDADANCNACETNWESVDCGTCPGNWDPLANCAACEYHWIDESNDCGTCPPGYLAADDCDIICGNENLEPGEPCDDGNSTSWDGCDACTIAEFQVNTWTDGNQAASAAAILASGGFVAIWTSYNDQDGFYGGIYGQRFDAEGLNAGTEFLVNETVEDDQSSADVAANGDGSFVVVWMSFAVDGDFTAHIMGRAFDAAGVPAGPEFHIDEGVETDPREPSVSTSGSGGFVVCWSVDYEDGRAATHCRLFDAGATPASAEFRADTTDVYYNTSATTRVSMAADGSFVVVWSGAPLSSVNDVFGQRFDSAGDPVGGEFVANSSTGYNAIAPDVAVGTGGEFVVLWTLRYVGDSYGSAILGQRFDSAGDPIGGEFTVISSTFYHHGGPEISLLDDGSFWVAWDSEDYLSTNAVFLQQFAADGSAIGFADRIHKYAAGTQGAPSISALDDGRFVIDWYSQDQDGSGTGIFAQRFAADGTPMGVLPW